MSERTKQLGERLLMFGGILLLYEVIGLITGLPYFEGLGSVGWIFFLGGVAIREENRILKWR